MPDEAAIVENGLGPNIPTTSSSVLAGLTCSNPCPSVPVPLGSN